MFNKILEENAENNNTLDEFSQAPIFLDEEQSEIMSPSYTEKTKF